ncbi:MAG: GNAT family N-acetyltransferase [Clostridia bacterium]|nr:GNAT family N-acetyltransferase [Clostridia bacterium]
MFIETERLIVRTCRAEDAAALYRIKMDPQVVEYCPDFLERNTGEEDIRGFIENFIRMEAQGDIDSWRCYAIENRETGAVMGCVTFSKNAMLHEYELGWMMLSQYTKKGYASEAAQAFAEYFCAAYGVDYLIVVMDVDNPASYHAAEKCGFKLFEKRMVYDYHYNRYGDDYYYFRRYAAGCTLREKYYGDVPYTGRGAE